MRYVAAALYALAIAGGRRGFLDALVIGALVFAGTVAFAFSVENIITQALRHKERP